MSRPFFAIRLFVFLNVFSVVTLVFSQETASDSPFNQWDKNSDGEIVLEEFPKRLGKKIFDRVDANHDGKISRKEDDDFRSRKKMANPRHAIGSKLVEDTHVERDVTYASIGSRKLPLDLYRPRASKDATPVVVWIHGGGWRSGSKNGIGPCAELLQRGYAIASVEYRLSGEATFPAAVEDCKAAISYLRANAKKYKLDASRMGVWGSSAGGHLAAMMGTTGDTHEFEAHRVAVETPSQVQAVCDWFGPTDFNRMNDVTGKIDHNAAGSPESRFIGAPIQENPALVAAANPITYVSQSDPPFLIMHGEVDDMVPYGQSELLYAALQKAGVKSKLVMVKAGNHGFRGAVKSRDELAVECADFFDSILKAKP